MDVDSLVFTILFLPNVPGESLTVRFKLSELAANVLPGFVVDSFVLNIKLASGPVFDSFEVTFKLLESAAGILLGSLGGKVKAGVEVAEIPLAPKLTFVTDGADFSLVEKLKLSLGSLKDSPGTVINFEETVDVTFSVLELKFGVVVKAKLKLGVTVAVDVLEPKILLEEEVPVKLFVPKSNLGVDAAVVSLLEKQKLGAGEGLKILVADGWWGFAAGMSVVRGVITSETFFFSKEIGLCVPFLAGFSSINWAFFKIWRLALGNLLTIRYVFNMLSVVSMINSGAGGYSFSSREKIKNL